MKLLFENWRKFLAEGMKQPSDLPDGIQVYVSPEDGDNTVVIKYVDEATGEEPTREKMYEVGRIFGSIYIRRYSDNKGNKCFNAWEVASSKSAGGYGPMLYDLAMEYATKNGGGLISDRHGVSEEAMYVWLRYRNSRDDVEKVQLDDLENTLTPEEEDNCIQLISIKTAEKRGGEWHTQPTAQLYKKNNTEMFDKAKAAGKLYGESALEEIIKKSGDEYCLKSKKGNKNLGCYPTKAGAEKRERQVQYFKHKG